MSFSFTTDLNLKDSQIEELNYKLNVSNRINIDLNRDIVIKDSQIDKLSNKYNLLNKYSLDLEQQIELNTYNYNNEVISLNTTLKSQEIKLSIYKSNSMKIKSITLKELKKFIHDNKVNENHYTSRYDCDSYTFEFITDLLNYDYISFPVYMEGEYKHITDSNWGHSLVSVYLNDGRLIYIEPQTDEILYELNIGDEYLEKDKIITKIDTIEGVTY
jgi:hypothetical protein